jgi:hypothetical protein
MSWSVGENGRASAVAKKIAEAFAGMHKCAEPEEAIKIAVAKIIADALAAYHPNEAVKVTASGSQFEPYGPDGKPTGDGHKINSLQVDIAPIYNFRE